MNFLFIYNNFYFLLLKVFLISFVILYIKIIAILYAIVLFTINLESENFLNKSFKIDEKIYASYFVRPLIFSNKPENFGIGTLFYYGYWNLVFDLTYLKILLGRKRFWFKIFSLKKFFFSVFFWYVGVSKLLFRLLIKILKINQNSIEDYLFFLFSRPNDDRLIIKINNEWQVNGKTATKVFNEIEEILRNKISYSQWNSMKIQLYKLTQKMWEISSETQVYSAKFIEINNKKKHTVFPESSKVEKFLGYQTEYDKACNNQFYNRKPLINKFQGPKKESTLLFANENEFKQITKEEKVNAINHFKGAIADGYDKTIISKNYENSINQILILENEFNNILFENNVNDEKLHKDLFELILQINDNSFIV